MLLCYLELLQQGNTIKLQVVKVATLKAYLAEAATWITDAGYPDPRFSTTWTHAPPLSPWIPRLKQALGRQRNWEIKAARKEPLTRKMVWDFATQAKKSHPDSLPAALYDWMALGLSAAFRSIEWAQETKGKVKCASMQLAKGKQPEHLPMAVTMGDIEFLDEHRCPFHGQDRERASYVAITWRTQKNNINGQIVTFGRAKTTYLCPVRAAWRIQERAERIQHPSGLLGVSSTGPIAKLEATQYLRACAARVYSYIDKADLEKYTLHSIRVGACVLLYELNKSAAFIKDRLRWRSDSFMDYLRDTPRIAALHAACL